jgi:hypothetical protein
LGSDAGDASGMESEGRDRGGVKERRRGDRGLENEHLELEEREVRKGDREEGRGRKRRREAWSADMEEAKLRKEDGAPTRGEKWREEKLL